MADRRAASNLMGTLYGPYARQIVNRCLKFWFALVTDRGQVIRYEVRFHPRTLKPTHRPRPFRDRRLPGPMPARQSNFEQFRVPDILAPYPSARFNWGTVAELAPSLLPDQDRADVTRLALTGELPRRSVTTETSQCPTA